jgi:3-hydroxyisobutyrate dehydrogenase-like beta-hydroxyacid dehydrogenase
MSSGVIRQPDRLCYAIHVHSAYEGIENMNIRTIGIVSPGDMGQAIAQCLIRQGFTVLTALKGRSTRTCRLAEQAGIEDAGAIAGLVERCDVLLSILVPSAAVATAREAADAMRASGKTPLFADCNATAPQTAQVMNELITEAGGHFVDAAIIGPPPRGNAGARLYVSGPQAARLTPLGGSNISVRVVGERIGDASAVKMCYGAMTKGAVALGVESLIAAEKLGVGQALMQEMRESRAETWGWLSTTLPAMPPKAYRWVPEMLEIASTFEALGMTRNMLEGAAEMYRVVTATPLGHETPEGRPQRTIDDVVAQLAAESPAAASIAGRG